MKSRLVFSIINIISIISVFFQSCSDISDLDLNVENSAKMIAVDFLTGENETRSNLVPSDNGTSFSWAEGDVTSVYSSSNGMTNFFINSSSISNDGLSAFFNGSGFSLIPGDNYYAFYPYDASSLDKSKIPVHWSGQNMDSNGEFKDLGNYDYMWATGVANNSGETEFIFNHIGCVVEYKIKVPTTAVYTQVRFELMGDDKQSLVKSGTVDLTSQQPKVEQDETLSSDTILRINLNKGNGFKIMQDSILHVYMMSAPQDLSSSMLVIRLVDSENNWYAANVDGKNMRAGYTYHYNIGQNSSDGEFTGYGSGLPDDYTFKEIARYNTYNNQGIYKIAVDGDIIYGFDMKGVLHKVDFALETPTLIASTEELGTKMFGRTILNNNNYIYAGLRQKSAGYISLYSPQEKLDFESGQSFKNNVQVSTNSTLNSFLKKIKIVTGDVSSNTNVYISKANKVSSGYKNMIYISSSDKKSMTFINKIYSTKDEALEALSDSYVTLYGDKCIVDWNSLEEGSYTFKSVSLSCLYDYDDIITCENVSIDELGTPSPCSGMHSCRLLSVGNGGRSLLLHNIEQSNFGEISFWLNVKNNQSAECNVPLLFENTLEKIGINISSVVNSSFSLSMLIDGIKSDIGTSFSSCKWYNFKIVLSENEITLYYRQQESDSWILLTNKILSESISFNSLGVGLETNTSDTEILIDDYFYNPTDIDNVTYCNGKLLTIDKEDLSVKHEYNLDVKVNDLALIGNSLVMSYIKGFNVYDISDPSKPKYKYCHRDFKEYQGISTFTSNGRNYALICNYINGYTIADVTDPNNVTVVATGDESNVLFDGVSLKGLGYNFDVVVDYPYAYFTRCSGGANIGTSNDYAGIIVMDLTDISSPKFYAACVPQSDLCVKKSGDHCPISIGKYGNTVLIDNGDKGLLKFDVSKPTSPIYAGMIDIGNSVYTLEIEDNGNLYIGEDLAFKKQPSIIKVRIE